MTRALSRRGGWLALCALAALSAPAQAQEEPGSAPSAATTLQVQLGIFESAVPEASAQNLEQRTERALRDVADQSGSGLGLLPRGQGRADVVIDARITRNGERFRLAYELRTTRLPHLRQPIVYELKNPDIGPGAARLMAQVLAKTARALEAAREQSPSNTPEAVAPTPPGAPAEPVVPSPANGAAPPLTPPEAPTVAVSVSGFVDAYFSQMYVPVPGKSAGAREANAEVRVRARLSDFAEGLASLNARFDPSSPWRNRVALWEANAELFFGPVKLKVGRMFVPWGGPLTIADKFNPRDLSDFLRPERVPVFGATTSVTFADFQLQLAAVPEVGQSTRPEVADLPFSAEDSNLSRDPWTPLRPTTTTNGQPQRNRSRVAAVPEVRIENASLGARLLYQGRHFSAGLSYFRGYDPLPIRVITRTPDPLAPTGVLIDTLMVNQRLQSFVLELGGSAFGVRAFAAGGFFRTSSFNDADPRLSWLAEPSWASVTVGFELRLADLTDWLEIRVFAQWRGESQVFLTGGQLTLDPRSPKSSGSRGVSILRHPVVNGPDGLLEIILLRKLHLVANWLWDVGDGGRYLTVSAGFEPVSGVRISAGSDFIGGPPTSFWGVLAQNQRFFIRLRCELGR